MYEIAIVGDVHITTKVSSRKDNYFETCLEKISEISELCQNIIFLGDVFDSPLLPNDYFSQLYNHLSYLKNKNNNCFYSIIGNHDIYNEREESLNKTTLGLCNLTGIIKVIKPLEPITINNYCFNTTYTNFEKAKQHLSSIKFNSNDILLLHHYYEDRYGGFTYEDLKNVGCSRIFLGHEHTPFENYRKIYNEFTIYRSGSIVRNNAGKQNLERSLVYYILDNNNVSLSTLSCQKLAKDVFTEKAVTQENLHKRQFLEDINMVIGKYTSNISNQTKFSIKSILEELNTPKEYVNYINTKYSKLNEVFN